jgi:hypothetical protein
MTGGVLIYISDYIIIISLQLALGGEGGATLKTQPFLYACAVRPSPE